MNPVATAIVLLRRAVLAARLPLVCVLLLAASAASAQSELRIAVEGAYPPFNYVEGQELAGFEVDLGRALCDVMGLPCTFVQQDWDGLYGALKDKRVDAVMSSMEITPERRSRYRFSRPYYQMPSVLIGRKDADIPKPFKPGHLAGRKVGVVEDGEFASYLDHLPGKPDIRPYHKLDEAALDLLAGRVDYVLGDKLEAQGFLNSREGQDCCFAVTDLPVDRGGGYAVAVRKGDRALADMFSDAIEKVVANGTYDRIRAKYLPFDIKWMPAVR